MTKKPLLVLPDTNSLLHFKRPDQVDWKAVVGRADVEIVLTPVPVQEIDKHARLHDVARIRAKARDLKSWIRSLLKAEGGLRIDSREPTGFITGGLDPQVPDDRLIASALMLHAEGHEVAIYTDDTLIHAKANGHPIQAVFPREEDRLKEEPDTVAKKVESLQRELDTLKNRKPRIALGWASGETLLVLSVGEAHLGNTRSPAKERKRLQPLDNPGAETEPHPLLGLKLAQLQNFGAFNPTRQQVIEYNESLEEYHQEYAKYYRSMKQMAEVESRIVELRFVARNDGTAPASSFRANVTLPDGLVLLEDQDAIGEWPKPPHAPSKPGVLGLLEEGRRPWSEHYPLTALTTSHLAHQLLWDDSPYLDTEDNSLELRRAKLLQHNPFIFDAAFVVVKPDLVGRSGALEFRLTAEELLTPITIKLPFKVDRS